MASSYSTITEQIQRIYARFLYKENTKETIDTREIKLLVGQSINRLLKSQTLERFNDGYIDIPRSSVITYTVSTTTVNGVSELTLPVVPVSLPSDMGVWEVSPINDPFNPYIPIPMMEAQVMQGTHAKYLETLTGFLVDGMTLRFTNIIGSTVNVKLLVHDLTQFSENDILPISGDIESSVIEEVLNIISKGRFAITEKETQ